MKKIYNYTLYTTFNTHLHTFFKKKCSELIYKPDSVLNDHLSRQYVAILLKQPTRILDE